MHLLLSVVGLQVCFYVYSQSLARLVSFSPTKNPEFIFVLLLLRHVLQHWLMCLCMLEALKINLQSESMNKSINVEQKNVTIGLVNLTGESCSFVNFVLLKLYRFVDGRAQTSPG